MKSFLSIIIFILCFELVSCEKKRDVEPTPNATTSNQPTYVVPTHTKTISVSNTIKEWGLFQFGSYWIVKDSISSNLDSVYVTAINTQTISHCIGDTNFIEEQIVIDFSNYVLHTRHHLSSFPKDNIKVSVSRPYITIFQPDTSTKDLGLVNFSYIPLGTIAGNNYTDLLREYHSEYVQNPSRSYVLFYEEAFWKKNVGLLKLNQQGGLYGVKEVIRFNVIQ